MTHIQTAIGKVPPEALGPVSMHEHLLTDLRVYCSLWDRPESPIPETAELSLSVLGQVRRNNRLIADNMVVDDVNAISRDLAGFAAVGGRTLVDMTSIGLRVDTDRVAEIARDSTVQIVLGTGLYLEPFWPDEFRTMTSENMADVFVREIEVGIDDTDVKAGHIGELGITDMSDRQRDMLVAGAIASNRTGASISVHSGTEIGSDPRSVADILKAAGVAPARVVFSHVERLLFRKSLATAITNPSSWAPRMDLAIRLLDQGFNLSFDLFGHTYSQEQTGFVDTPDWQRVSALYTLIDRGYADQLVLGTDVCQKMLTVSGGGLGYQHLFTYVVPALRRLGVGQREIEKLLVSNPARILAF